MLASGSQRKGNTQNQVSNMVIVFSYSVLISIWKLADSYGEQLIYTLNFSSEKNQT